MAADAYETVEEYSRRIVDLEKTDFLLRWDSDVMMPPGGATARSSQRTTIAAARARYLTDDELGAALDTLDETALSADQAAVVREIRREHEVATSVPDELSDEIARITTDAHEAWKEASDAGDWSRFAPSLADHFDAKRAWADHVDPDRDPYAVLWEERTGYHSQPYLPIETVEAVLDELEDELIELIDAVRASSAEPTTDAFDGQFDVDTQEEVCQDALDVLGLDRERARLDRAPHPFSYGTQFDVRLTTRFDEAEPLDGLTAALHEFGHTAYTLGLPREQYGTPLGEPRGLGVHESQSRFYENHVGRTEAFWELFLPKMRERFPDQLDGVTPREAYEAVNQVYADNRIRVEADELTYHLHILLRTEIERELVAGRIEPADVPDVWAERMDEYLGIEPRSPAEGPLQDPHWSSGLPAFLSYTVGSVLAAQLHAAMEDDLGPLDDYIRAGEFEPIHDWLTEHVHRHGQRYPTQELIERATGEPLTADYFLEYVTEKYGELYEL